MRESEEEIEAETETEIELETYRQIDRGRERGG